MPRRTFLFISDGLTLFDLESNPVKKHNLFNEQPENVLKLKTLLQNRQRQVKHNR